jgi:hypothetical protein
MGARSEIKEYLRSDRFRDKLVRQYARYEILSEGGLRTAVANLLHTKIENIGQPAEAYRVTCETRIRFSYGDRIPDVLIWKGEHPRMWIELKDTRNFDQGNAESDILCFCVYGIVLRPCLGEFLH